MSKTGTIPHRKTSGVTGRGQSAPQRLLTGKFLLMYQEKRGKDKGHFFCFSLLKTTGICFGSTKCEFSIGKKHFTPGKKSGKITLPPRKNMPVMPLQKKKPQNTQSKNGQKIIFIKNASSPIDHMA